MKRLLSLVSITLCLMLLAAACRPLDVPETPTVAVPSETPTASPMPPTETAVPTANPTEIVAPTPAIQKEIWTGRPSYYGYPNFVLDFNPVIWESTLKNGYYPSLVHKSMPCSLTWMTDVQISARPVQSTKSALPYATGEYQVLRFSDEDFRGRAYYLSDQGTGFSVNAEADIVDLETCMHEAEEVLVTFRLADMPPTPSPTDTNNLIWMGRASDGISSDFVLEFNPQKWDRIVLYGAPTLVHKVILGCRLFWVQFLTDDMLSAYSRTEDITITMGITKYSVTLGYTGERLAFALYITELGSYFGVVADENMNACREDAENVLMTFRTFGDPFLQKP